MGAMTISAAIAAIVYLTTTNAQMYVPQAVKSLYGPVPSYSSGGVKSMYSSGIKTIPSGYSGSYKTSYSKTSYGGTGSGSYMGSGGSGSYGRGGAYSSYMTGGTGTGGSYSAYIASGGTGGTGAGSYSGYLTSGGHGSEYLSTLDCNPPCQNGGKCVSLLCLCPNEYTGLQCQYKKETCSFKKMKFTGAYKCSDNGEEVTCTVTCPEGSSFEYPPAPSYVCRYLTGQYLPANLPQCILHDKNAKWVKGWETSSSSLTGSLIGIKESTIIRINSTKIGGSGRKIGAIKIMPRPGICFTWGGVHYKTFDGKVFSFASKCSYVLVRDGVDNTFGIMVQNNKNCTTDPENCYRIIKIFLQDKQYFLKQTDSGAPIFASSEKELSIPLQLPGLRVSKLAHYIVIDFDSIGAKLKWDGQQLVQVEVTESLWNKTEGLCGRIDGNPDNDILTKLKRKPKNIYTLATSWKTDDFGEVCSDIPTDKSACEKNKVLQLKAATYCKKLLSNQKFEPCHKIMETSLLLDACKWDYCACNSKKNPAECACETMNVYVKECAHKGVNTLQNWRDADTCPINCTGGQIYKSCGSPAGQLTCSSPIEITPTVEDLCVEGCFCPEGTVFHENKCISRENCPCKMRGKQFESGQTVEKDCNTCTCKGGQWICTELSCGARCSVIGDPHYTTFDGKHYDFMGQCAYYLIKAGNFSIETENIACAGSISHNLGYINTVSTGTPSCTKSVIIKIDGQEVVLKLNQLISVNGVDIEKLPYTVAGIVIKEVTSSFVQVLLTNGIIVWWDGNARLYIDIPANFEAKTKGLCGTYNNNQKDDFLTPENDIEQAVIPFANKWKSRDKCSDLPNILITHPCDANFEKKSQAETLCSALKSQIFAECHWRVDPEQFYQDCLYDMCSCAGIQTSTCLCPIIASYAEECLRQGLQIDWRNEIKQCGMQCTGGQKYQLCGNSCARSCADFGERATCKQQCVEGCNCPEGEALDENGECVEIGQCSCRYNDVDYPAGYNEIRTVNGEPHLCTCLNAVWSCNIATVEDLSKYSALKDGISRCNVTDNFEFTTCKPLEEVTCKNMHNLSPERSLACQPGCRCKKGYILDTSRKICVKPSECPCHHGGKSYGENEKFHIDCNTCICKDGKWRCSEKECPGECSAWGDSHFKTFDGKHYDYQGQCDYVLAKGSTTTGSFDISIENVPCGSLGTTCSKSLSIRVGFGNEKEIITLTRGKPIPQHATYTHLTLRQKGLFVIIEAPDLALTVLWDKGTRVYVKLDSRWHSKIKGLCGNFNGNIADDFQTPSGGISEVSAKIFGDSWKLQSYCPESIEVEDTCEGRPDRKVWALKKCGILKSHVFARCHDEVALKKYFDKCVFDSCACDEGDDCQCLCTALAAYAQECNNKGVHIKWRSQELCPIQCDERCSSYSPCISTCPTETCENLISQDKLSKSCEEDTCVEGCEIKPCPPGHVYYNSSHLECVPRKSCKTICKEIDGKIFYEGDITEEDECHTCSCTRGEILCAGTACVETVEDKPLPKNDKIQALVKCKSGWTKWINQNNIGATKKKVKKGDRNKKKDDIEPIPSTLILNNLEDSARCDKEQIKKIQCRTVKSRLRYNETGLDVSCNIKDGLICRSSKDKECQDFEIRVFCECEENKPGAPLEDFVLATEPKKCPPGSILDDCAFECDRMCDFYAYKVKESGFCQNGIKCESDCVETNRKPCPSGQVWANNQTCVAIQDCMCRSHDGTPVKPGTVYQESDCEFCQCVDNYYTCDKSACQINYITESSIQPNKSLIIEDEIIEETQISQLTPVVVDQVLKETEIFIPNTVTPPNKCDEKNYIDLIQGDFPLPDSAFNASSISNKHFSPWFSRINSKVTSKSGGSWAPAKSTADQYLEIDLGRLEPIYGVIVKGSPLYDEYVTSFKVLYSPDGHKYCYVVDQDYKVYTFRGSVDPNTPVKQIFPVPIEAKVVRINPQTWHNEISLRVELIGCADSDIIISEIKTSKPNIKLSNQTQSYESSTSTKFTTITTTTTTTTTEYYQNPMGLSDGTMSDQQIIVSSELDTTYDKSKLKINSESVWQPLTNSPTEFVQFDFLDKRYITGIETKGGPDGWVTAYKIEYSPNGKDWSTILDENKNEQIFLGNYDSTTSQKNYFVKPIYTRFIKIVPLKWYKNIQMKIELLGKFQPYPVTAEEIKTITKTSTCKYCPGVLIKEDASDCICSPEYWFDGEKCVSRAQCPCFARKVPYEVGSIFENENCAKCICKLGGVSYCKPKKCDKCEEGLRSTITSTCECSCQPCPEGTVLCPTSNICIDSDSWCDGVLDCPDDEVNCVEIVEPIELIPGYTKEKVIITEQVIKEETCPKLECPPGFKREEKKNIKSSYLSPMFSTYSSTKNKAKTAYVGIKSGTKTVKKPQLRRPSNSTSTILSDSSSKSNKCPEFRCISSKAPPKFINGKKECPPATCPQDYILVYDEDDVKSAAKECPRYICNPPPPPEAICNVTADTFNTFDGVEFEYDVCNHVIARDLANDEWDITLKKSCTKLCTRTLTIRHHSNTITLHPALSVEYDGYKYTVDQTKKIGSQTQAFSISRLGNTLLFTSNRYGFWIIWDNHSNLKLGIVRKLLNQVDGLCGFFNENPKDDKRKPDGALARTTTLFGESWALEQSDCEEKRCPVEAENKAYQICNKVKDESFEACSNILNIQAFISRCTESTCECLRGSNNSLTSEDDCRCQALQAFVLDCLSANPDIDLSHWRMQQDCPATCDAPLVYHDCYSKKCEPTCETVGDPNACPKVPHICFPGCYCPPGLVRKGDNCIQASTCRDCECNVLPHLKYVTYDESNFTVDGNCTYIMSRDIINTKSSEHKFQVLVTNEDCKTKKDKKCVAKVTILFKKHKLEIFNNFIKYELKLQVDGKVVTDFNTLSKWIGVRRTSTKHLKFQLKGAQIEISVYYPSLGVSIKAPSHKYGGRLEGLCGDCNKDPDNDIPNKYPTIEENVDKLVLDWLSDAPSDKDKCKNQPVKSCKELPPDADPCQQILDTNKFGQCLRILDPDLFLEWCKTDTCDGSPELSCTAIEAYARDCASAGFCVNWRNDICPPKTCPPGLIYNSCGPSCPKTCDSIKNKGHKCAADIPVEGCFCPEGKVLLNNTCVEPKDCEICDEEGHHPGDVWKKDKCTSCRCDESSVKCETQQCNGMNMICEEGFAAVKVPTTDEECCDKYTCVPSKMMSNPTCEPPQKLSCASGQTMKLTTKSDGCQQFVCECKPADQCDPIDKSEKPLDDGYVKEIDNTGCCPVVNYICKKELCPKPPECPQYFNLNKITIPGKCCDIYECLAPNDKCIYEAQYTAAQKGGERLRTKYEKQQLVKNLNETWQDGPCRDCKCLKTSSGAPVASCTQTECASIESSRDFAEYVLESSPVFEQCCPVIKRTACKHNGNVYNIGEKWTTDEDFCTSFECKETENGPQKEVLITSCDTNCDLGFEYEPAPPNSKKCCGSCKATACVVDGVMHKVDEQWKSQDFCTNYFCVFVNGTAQMQAFLVNCPETPKDYDENYVYDTIDVDGECCKKIVTTACKINGKIYKEGEIAPSPDGDKCKQITCIRNEQGELIKQTHIETCKSDCPKGFDFKPYDDKCCGECVAIACVIADDVLKLPGETWTSDDSCTTYTCEKIGEQLTVSATQESCPSIDDCPDENIYIKGCCKHCNITSGSQVLSSCSPIAIDVEKTVGLVKANHTTHGKCVNKNIIDGFTECIGNCHSATAYNPIVGNLESICECCKGIKMKPIEIELECEDGFTWKKKLSVPVSCKCQGCNNSGIKTG